jgi:hypothetical protein
MPTLIGGRWPSRIPANTSPELLTLGRSFDYVRLGEPDFAQDDGAPGAVPDQSRRYFLIL